MYCNIDNNCNNNFITIVFPLSDIFSERGKGKYCYLCVANYIVLARK